MSSILAFMRSLGKKSRNSKIRYFKIKSMISFELLLQESCNESNSKNFALVGSALSSWNHWCCKLSILKINIYSRTFKRRSPMAANVKKCLAFGSMEHNQKQWVVSVILYVWCIFRRRLIERGSSVQKSGTLKLPMNSQGNIAMCAKSFSSMHAIIEWHAWAYTYSRFTIWI